MGNFVVKHRKLILVLTAVLLIPAIIGFLNTRINYDMLNYLPSSMDTVKGQQALLDEFGKGGFSMVITEGLDDHAIYELEQEIKQVDHVDTALSLGTLESANLPAEIIPDNIYNTFHKNNESIIAVFFDTSSSADETITAIKEIRGIVDGKASVSGMSAFVADLRNLSQSEQGNYIIIAVTLALIVMIALLDNWLAPILFLLSIGVMVIYNLGTNIFLGEISYLTKALSAILQLAVTMDYSIFLYHSYREELESGKSTDSAMATAIKATLSSVVGSSATTVAGFIALCFMTFTLGLDLGLVMAKGVILGVIGSITVLPALILALDKPLRKLDHKSLLPDFDKTGKLIINIFPIFIIAFVAIIPPFLYGYQQTNANVYYTVSDSLPQDMEFAIANRKLSENFGLSNVHMILTNSQLSQDKVINMTNQIKSTTGIKSVLSLESALGNEIPAEALPHSVANLNKSDQHELILAISEYKTSTNEMATQIDSLNQIIKSYDENAYLIGEASLTNDMIRLTSVDFQVVNTVSIIAIFIIIAIVTNSISLPFILIAVIESAIFINLGLPFYTGTRLSFITPICISTIQLGATVDYAILLTTRYKRERLNGRNSKKAAFIATKTSLPSIIVSGAVLFAATIGVAIYSKADMISSMCMLMARGAIISIILVPTILPSLLILTDPLIIRTTLKMKKLTKGTNK